MKLKSYGYCTKNEFGMFEVFWEKERTFIDKILNRKTSFRAMSFCSLESIYTTNPDTVLWIDEDHNPIDSEIPRGILRFAKKELGLL